MVNRDYILRIIERFTRALAHIIFLRETNRHQDALIYIDDLFMQTVGMSSGAINALPEELLMGLMTRMGELNVEKCLWIALLLKAEADTYNELGTTNESYARYLKSLHLFLTALLPEKDIRGSGYFEEVEAALSALQPYELPLPVRRQVIQYYEQTGQYAKAEDSLFEGIEGDDADSTLFQQGEALYRHLRQKSEDELVAGGLSQEEVREGQAQVEALFKTFLKRQPA